MTRDVTDEASSQFSSPRCPLQSERPGAEAVRPIDFQDDDFDFQDDDLDFQDDDLDFQDDDLVATGDTRRGGWNRAAVFRMATLRQLETPGAAI